MVGIKKGTIPKLVKSKAGKKSAELIIPAVAAMRSLFVFAETEGFPVQPNPYGLGQGHQSLGENEQRDGQVSHGETLALTCIDKQKGEDSPMTDAFG